jgi:hypothetical protein
MKLHIKFILLVGVVSLIACSEQPTSPQPTAAAPETPATQAPVVEEKPQTKEERIQEIKLWYSEVQKIGMKNCESKKRVKYDNPFSPDEKIPFDQVVKTCKLDDHYELIRGDFMGYEWSQQLTIYKKDGKIFFVLVEGASEGWSYVKRYYCDKDENLIQLLENEADGGEEVKGPGKETKLDPAKPKIQDNISSYLSDVNFVLTGK